MKKFLSLVMSALFMFQTCNVKGYEVENLPDGGKKVIYKYEELNDLIRAHEQIKNELNNLIEARKKRNDKIEKVSTPMSVVGMLAGTVLFGIGLGNVIEKKSTVKSKAVKIASGATLAVASLASLVGVPIGLERQVNSLRNEQYAIEERVSVIDGIKHRADKHMADGLVSEDETTRDFYYAISVDKSGLVYEVEHGGAGFPYTKIPLKTKYKFDGQI